MTITNLIFHFGEIYPALVWVDVTGSSSLLRISWSTYSNIESDKKGRNPI